MFSILAPPDEKSEVGKLWVEFDDGDSGIFPLSDLRKIITDCPVQVDGKFNDIHWKGYKGDGAIFNDPVLIHEFNETSVIFNNSLSR